MPNGVGAEIGRSDQWEAYRGDETERHSATTPLIACVANRSTRVRKLIKPMMTSRTAAPCPRDGLGAALLGTQSYFERR
jgi:hypothetical protein